MIIHLKQKLPFNIAAITSFPFIVFSKGMREQDYYEKVLAHEMVHYNRAKLWCIRGLGVGLLVHNFLYVCCLPFGWNPFRRKWETEAFVKVNKYSLSLINLILRKAPYWLWI